ncbi:MAG: prephenate dehydrogenase/arogenate dehydrogenase family protein, partial [bacterium]
MHKSSHKGAETTRLAGRQRLAILGLGLMGGSLGLALRKRPDSPIVCGYARRTTTRKLALKMGAVDEAFATPQEAVRLADIVVICTPILSIPAIARACAPTLSPAAFVTDVGSTKAQLASQMAALHIPFIGSHPIAG